MLRSFAVGGALVGSLAMASSASAALGGAASAHFSNRPNLESVTFNGQVAAFHFDKAVQPNGGVALDPDDFSIGGYRAISTNTPSGAPDTANIAVSDPKTVLVTYSFDTPDYNAATFGAVRQGIVQGIGTFATPNLADATKLTGSASESGTRGHTTGPDLQSVAVNLDNNQIIYTFDQDVDDDTTPNSNNFQFIDSNGDLHNSDAVIDIDDNVVTARFPGGAGNRVDQARQAVVRGVGQSTGNPVISNDNPATEASTANVDIPGRPSLTADPSLVSATLEPNTFTIVYTFDQPIGAATANRFGAGTSNGEGFTGSSATIIGNTVRVTFTGIELFTEHVVTAPVLNGAVVGTNGNAGNRGGKAVGGNAGAKASGYTTAPDALSATFNPTSGQVSVLFDSRIINADPNNFRLLSDLGDFIATPSGPPSIIENIGGPTQARVVLQFQPTQVGIASVLQIRGSRNVGGSTFAFPNGPAVIGSIPFTTFQDNFNVQTNLVPSQTSTNFKTTK